MEEASSLRNALVLLAYAYVRMFEEVVFHYFETLHVGMTIFNVSKSSLYK